MNAKTIKKLKANMKLNGERMAAANIFCTGTPNDKGQFYDCVEEKLKQEKLKRKHK